jgi:hypothetical protein
VSHIVLGDDNLTLCGLTTECPLPPGRCASCRRELVSLGVRLLTRTSGNAIDPQPIARRPWEMA